MRRWVRMRLLKILVLAMPFSCFAQNTGGGQEIDRHLEIGAMLGGINYTGDLSPHLNILQTKPGGAIFYRHNFANLTSVLRGNLMFGQVGAKEAQTGNALPEARALEFERTLTEVSVLYEYDFFNYRDIKNQFYMSPYLFGGVGVTVLWGGSSPAMMNIPFGVGVKYRLYKGLNIGAEMGARWNFSDNLDGQTDNIGLSSSENRDWYYFTGVTVSYTVYRLICKEKPPVRI